MDILANFRQSLGRFLIAGGVAFAFAAATNADPLLPDLIPWVSQAKNYIYGGTVNASLVPGKTVYRFNLPIPNIGDGPLELREQTHPDKTQDIYQRIYDSEGGISEVRLDRTFTDAYPPYGHMYLQGIAHYRIRAVVPGDLEGDDGAILTTHEKISYALVDGPQYNLSLPGAPPTKHYTSTSAQYLGISVGWADIYTSTLPLQWADVTGLANGQYWLEVEIDPFNLIREKDETNNLTRIKLNLTIPESTILAGDYNTDGIVDAADYTVWRNAFGQNVSVQGSGADGDGNRRIGPPDYDVWKAHFGETDPSPGAGGSAIPEPTAVALLAVAACWTLAAGRLRTRRTVAANGP